MLLGGDYVAHLRELLNDSRVLASTLLPSDLSPDTRYLIAPSEVHPVYNVTGVDWIGRNCPQVRRVALCSQRDGFGLPSLATYRAAFKAAGHQICKDVQYAPDATDVASIVQPMLDESPDLLCWCTSYTPMVHAMTEYAHAQGFRGMILSCTLDQYDRLVARTSAQFMEGAIFQFPDFDDPALAEKAFFFNQPHGFYAEYQERFPNSWSAVSWEYVAILDIWHCGGGKGRRAERGGGSGRDEADGAGQPCLWPHAENGGARHIFFRDQPLARCGAIWPVVSESEKESKARIVEFGSVPTAGWTGTKRFCILKCAILASYEHQKLVASGVPHSLHPRVPGGAD